MAGTYYDITLAAEADRARTEMLINVRVVESRLQWIWIGAGIAVLVIAGVIVIFRRLGQGD